MATRIRRLAAAMALAAVFAACSGRKGQATGQALPPRAALVLPPAGADYPEREAFGGFYAVARERGARFESGEAVYDFGSSALLRAEAPVAGGADSVQAIERLAEWSQGLVVLAGGEYAEIAARVAAENPAVRFVVLDARAPENAPTNCFYATFEVGEAAFLAGALAGGALSSAASPGAGFAGLVDDPDAGDLAAGFKAGLEFALGAGKASMELRLADGAAKAGEALKALSKGGSDAILAGRGMDRGQARALAASSGALLLFADFGARDALRPAPLAWVEKRFAAAAALALDYFLDGGPGPGPRLDADSGCVGISLGDGAEGIAAPHGELIKRAEAALASGQVKF